MKRKSQLTPIERQHLKNLVSKMDVDVAEIDSSLNYRENRANLISRFDGTTITFKKGVTSREEMDELEAHAKEYEKYSHILKEQKGFKKRKAKKKGKNHTHWVFGKTSKRLSHPVSRKHRQPKSVWQHELASLYPIQTRVLKRMKA